MSTKIYNAYIMEQNVSMTGFHELLNELKVMCTERLLENHYENVAYAAASLIDESRIMALYPDIMARKYEDFNKHVLDLYNKATMNPQRILKGAKPENNVQSAMEKLARYEHLNVLRLATHIVENLSEKAQITECSFGYSPKNELVAFPQDNRMLFIVFGKQIERILADGTNETFLRKWRIKDYHYQNQTDIPEEITDEEWKQREKDWDEVMPSGVPAIDGISITLTDIYDLERKTFMITPEDILKHIVSTKKRQKRIAEHLIKIMARDPKTDPHEQLAASRKAMTEIEKESGIWYAAYLDLMNAMEETVKDITEKDLESQITEILK